MHYANLSIKYTDPKPIARSLSDGRVVYALGAAIEGHRITEYGYISTRVISLSKIPDRVNLAPVDSFFKLTPHTDWEYFE